MQWFPSFRRNSSRRRRDHEFAREIAFHLDRLTRDYEAAGLSPEEALRRARIDFGGREQVTQQLREVHLSALVEAARAHARAAFRFLRRAPGLSAAVILTLALGIGANTAVFSAIDAVIVRPLPFPEGDRLMAIHQYNTKTSEPRTFTAPVRVEDWNRLSHGFQAISGYYTEDESETSGALPERLEEALVAPRFLQVLGIAPELGREFTPAEEHFGGPHAMLISDRLWRRRFHADADVLGRGLHFGKSTYAIVGVLPASLRYPNADIDLFEPSPADAPFAQDRGETWYTVIGRLKPGVTRLEALADLSTVQRQLGAQFPKTDGDLGIEINPLKSVIVGDIGGSLWLLYGAVTLLLLIACINIAALLAARTADREREMALRFALGASRRMIVLQLLSEVMLLAVLGAMAGLALAGGAVEIFHALAKTLPRAQEIALDWNLLLYALLTALVAAFASGLYPALRGTRRELAHALAQGGHTQVSGRASGRGGLQWLLVSAQVAFAVTLLVGAGLLLRSFEELGRVSPGFEAAHVLTLQLTGSYAETTDMKRLSQRVDGDLDAVRAVPGVEAAATAAMLPGVPGMTQQELTIAGRENNQQKVYAASRWVSDGYFAVLRTPMLLGEGCRRGPANPQNQSVVVNKSFADRYFAQSPATGHTIQTPATSTFPFSATIRGIVADARDNGLNTAPMPTVYWCTSAPDPSPWFLVRTKGSPMALAQTIRMKLHQVESSRSVFAVSPLEEHIADSQSENRLRTSVLSFFAGTAIALACLGLYGTLNYLGRQRRREMGLRLAVGASRAQVVGSLLSRGLGMVATGCAAGLAMGLGASRLLAGMLYAVSPADPETYAGIVLLVAVVACVACAGPALRAATTDPARVLREE